MKNPMKLELVYRSRSNGQFKYFPSSARFLTASTKLVESSWALKEKKWKSMNSNLNIWFSSNVTYFKKRDERNVCNWVVMSSIEATDFFRFLPKRFKLLLESPSWATYDVYTRLMKIRLNGCKNLQYKIYSLILWCLCGLDGVKEKFRLFLTGNVVILSLYIFFQLVQPKYLLFQFQQCFVHRRQFSSVSTLFL